MKIGICLPHYGRPIEVGRMLEVVRRAEDRGLDSIWVTDHVIVPRDVNIIYKEHMLDPLAVLPWLSGITQRVSLGTSVIIAPYRSPIPVAKLLASADVLSGGRLIFGVAVGWMEGEFAALGVPIKERASRTDEMIQLVRALWAQEFPETQTKRYRLQGVKASPLPLQKPMPPIYVGGSSDGALRRAARLADGWHATATNHQAFRQGAEAVARFWKEAGKEGSPALSLRIPVLIDGVHRWAVDMSLMRGRYTINGTVAKVTDELRGFQSLGCSHVALEVSYTTFPAILETIDILAGEVKPKLAG